MAENTLGGDNILLVIACAFIWLFGFCINFTFLVTLLKMRRLNHLDKSNYLLTHLIALDLFITFLVVVPTGYSVYNSNSLSPTGCFVQLFFTTLFITVTFLGLLALNIERYIKYKYPVWHTNTFTVRLQFDDCDRVIREPCFHIVYAIIGVIWLVGIFVSFIPMFANYGQIQYYETQTQCDYVYERYIWWLYFFFFVIISTPVIIGFGVSMATYRVMHKAERSVKLKRAHFEANNKHSSSGGDERVAKGVDVTLQPFNRFYYSHVLDEEELARLTPDTENESNDFHVRNQLLAQYKYDTERSKYFTFLYLLVINYLLLLPVFIIHFYRASNNTSTTLATTTTITPTSASTSTTSATTDYDNPTLVSRPVYTSFVLVFYMMFVAKSVVCLVQNRFYRYTLYQAANCRGFSGQFDFQKEVNKLKDMLELKTENPGKSGKRNSTRSKNSVPHQRQQTSEA